MNIATNGVRIGAIVRFLAHPDGTFTCYRLIINSADEVIRLSRLAGTYNGSTYELDAAGRTEIWSCSGAACGVNFLLTTHDVALTCNGTTITIEVDGAELAAVSDPGGLPAGKAGIYYEGDEDPAFSELVVRSAPRAPVHRWHFVTSRYAGFVEHLDTFDGTIYQEAISGVDAQQLADAVAAAESGMAVARQQFEASSAALEQATPAEVAGSRAEAQQAAEVWHAEAATHFDALYRTAARRHLSSLAAGGGDLGTPARRATAGAAV